MKKCSTCKEEKDLDCFYSDKRKKDGKTARCKDCQITATMASAAKKPEARKATKKAYREANKEKISSRSKAYGEENREKLNAYNRQYRLDNKEKCAAYQKERNTLPEVKARKAQLREENRERYNSYSNKYYHANQKKCIESNKRSRQKNPEIARERVRRRRENLKAIEATLSSKQRDAIFSLFENKCFNCSTTESLTIDHHYPISTTTPLLSNNAVVLCQSCNSKKGTKQPEDFYSTEQLEELTLYLN